MRFAAYNAVIDRSANLISKHLKLVNLVKGSLLHRTILISNLELDV